MDQYLRVFMLVDQDLGYPPKLDSSVGGKKPHSCNAGPRQRRAGRESGAAATLSSEAVISIKLSRAPSVPFTRVDNSSLPHRGAESLGFLRKCRDVPGMTPHFVAAPWQGVRSGS